MGDMAANPVRELLAEEETGLQPLIGSSIRP